MRRTSKSSSSRATSGFDDADLLSRSRVEEDYATVRKRTRSAYTDFNPTPNRTTLEVEILCRQLCKERRKGVVRDRLMLRMWKMVKAIFTCVVLEKALRRLEPPHFRISTC